MGELARVFQVGSAPFVLFLMIVLLCVVGMVGAGKEAETIGVLFGVAVAYILMWGYGPGLPALIPFGRYMAGEETQTILSIMGSDVISLAGELLDLFALAVIVKVGLSVAKPVSGWVRGLPLPYGLSSLVSLLVYYAACVAAMWGYTYLAMCVFSAVPSAMLALLAFLVFLLTGLVLLSPLADFLAIAAGVAPIPALKKISAFVKEHTLGGNLQAVFYATFFATALMVVLQEAGVTLSQF